MSRGKMITVLTFILVLTLAVGGLLISTRTPPATVKIYKTTTPAPKTEVRKEVPSNFNTETDTGAVPANDVPNDSEAAIHRAPVDASKSFLGEPNARGLDASEVSEDKVDYGSSPFGYGTYPEIPTDYPHTPIWTRSAQARAHYSRGNPEEERILELMSRVRLKLWEMGERHVKGVAYANGLMYPTQPDTVYVDIQDFKDGGSISAIGSPISEEDMDLISIGLSPPGITVLDMSEGIEPISFLGL